MTKVATLSFLEAVLADGRLKKAVERDNLGHALEDAENAIVKHQARLDLLPGFVTAARLVLAQCDSSDCENIHNQARTLTAIGQSIKAADDEAALKAIPVQLVGAVAAINALQMTLQRVWKDRLNVEFSALQQLAKVLQRSAPELSVELSQLVKDAEALKLTLPATGEEEANFQVLRQRRESLLSAMTNTGLTERVRNFLIDALKGRATLADVDTEVRQWFESRNTLNVVRLSLDANSL